MQQLTRESPGRPSLLRRNLILVASYIAILALIAIGYTG
jgi:hypothetical protein